MTMATPRLVRRMIASACVCIGMVAFTSTPATPKVARPAPSCEHVVSYVLYPYQGSELQHFEWRIFDPSRGADELFLSLPSGFVGVRWDTTFSAAYFISGDSLCSVEWQWEAAPTVLSRLPEGMAVADWWFNPDSACWQLLTIVWQSESDHDYYSKYFGELWQRSRDGALWRRIRSDTLGCADEACTQWEAADGPLGSRVRMIGWESLASSGGSAALTDEAARLDTSTVRLLRPEDDEEDWYYLPSQRSSHHGIGFRTDREGGTQISGPYFTVDLDLRSKRLIRTHGDESERWTYRALSEHCGAMLIPSLSGPLVLDLESETTVLSLPWNSEEVLWIRAPRKPHSPR